jgi:hypothetical protein
MVRVRGGFGCLVALFTAVMVCLSLPGRAGQLTQEQREEADLFVLGNTVFILYHELGHALIDQLGLPVLGHEEDAADNLASIMMIPEQADPMMDELIIAAADGWYLGNIWQREAGNTEPAWWGEHALDMQRFYSVVCLMYGSDPAGFSDLAASVSLPADRRTTCPADYAQARAGWTRLLAPHMNPVESRSAGNSRISLEFEAPDPAYGYVSSLLHESGLINAIARDIGSSFKLPSDLTVRFRNCGADTANAFYDRAGPSVTLCYELVAFYNELILRDISRR